MMRRHRAPCELCHVPSYLSHANILDGRACKTIILVRSTCTMFWAEVASEMRMNLGLFRYSRPTQLPNASWVPVAHERSGPR